MSNQRGEDLAAFHKIKSKYFFDKNLAIHVKFKLGYFKNGIIKELSDDFFILDDFKFGDLPIFYQEIERIEEYKTKGELR